MSLVAPPVDAAPASRLDSRALAAAVGAAVLGGLVYLNALQNPFVYDDYHTVAANASIQRVSDLRAIVLHDVTRPLVNLSYAVDRALWGPRPLGFHVTNVLLHMLNVVLLFLLARRMEMDRRSRSESDAAARGTVVAVAAALLFAVHPMMTEAVGYISGRSEVLCATFFIPAMLCGRRWLQDGARKWAAPTLLLWTAALATKEPAAMFPFVLFAYDWLMLGGTAADRRHRVRTVHVPLIGVATIAGIIRLAILARVEYAGRATVHWPYILVELDVIRRYVGLLVYPAGQALFHEVSAIRTPFDPRGLVALLAIGALVAIIWRLRRVDATASLGMIWFLLLLVPSSVLILFDQGEPMAEHRVYLASCGAFLAVGSGVGWVSGWSQRAGSRAQAAVTVLFALVVLSFGADTWVRNAVWSSPVTLWSESVSLAPTHYRPRLLLGEALEDEGRRDAAIEQYKTAIRLRPTVPDGYVRLGRSLAETGRFDDARRQFLRAIEVDPQDRSARQSLKVLDSLSALPHQP
jgi:hypothetical protein